MAEQVQFKIKMPADVHSWLRAVSEHSLRSMSAEIIFALRERMAATGEEIGVNAPAAASRTAALQGGNSTQGC